MSEYADAKTPEDILRRFPGPLILLPSSRKWAGLIVIGVCLMILSFISMARSPVTGILGLIFFAVATVVAIAAVLPGSSSLRLDRESFIRTRLYHAKRYRWSEVRDFSVWTWRGTGFVVFEVTKPRLNPLEKMNKAISGRNGYLPDTYGLAAKSLVQLMIGWQNLAIKEISA